MTTLRLTSFIDALHADGPAADRAAKMQLYGRFVGRWEADIRAYEEDGTRHDGKGEIHFGWVLEGRAVQDVWITPPRGMRAADAPVLPVAGNWYGTTLRVYDLGADAWHIFWIDPAKQFFTRQVGRACGDRIVQEGPAPDGSLMRWSFNDITPTSFLWRGEHSTDGGATWRLQVEVLARRVAG